MDDGGRGTVVLEPALAALGAAELALLTTFRRDGRGVGTPVGVAMEDNRVYFMTLPDTGKVTRLANDPRVVLAPCSHLGARRGPAVGGIARQLTGIEADRGRAAMAGGFWGRLWLGTVQLRHEHPLVFEVAPVEDGARRGRDGGP